MTFADWLRLGLKLLGVYFVVEGLATGLTGLLTCLVSIKAKTSVGLAAPLAALAYLVAGYLLVRYSGIVAELCRDRPHTPAGPVSATGAPPSD